MLTLNDFTPKEGIQQIIQVSIILMKFILRSCKMSFRQYIMSNGIISPP